MSTELTKPFIIAEIGNNHEGSFSVAKKLVVEAAKAGVDAVKFQTFDVQEFLNEDHKNFKLYKKFQLSKKQFIDLSILTKKLQMKFISTPLDIKSSDFLSKIVDIFKIASGDNNFELLIENVLKYKKKTLISTGLLNFREIKKLKLFINSKKFPLNKLIIMHCVSAYPTKLNEANLLSIKYLKDKLKINIGYSDHTIGILAPIIAYTQGASIIEKHFTLDNNFSNFRDHSISLNPSDMKKMVEKLKETHDLIGKYNKIPTASELKNKRFMRRSIYAKKDILKNNNFDFSNLKFVRPENLDNLKTINRIIKKKSKTNIKKNKLIKIK